MLLGGRLDVEPLTWRVRTLSYCRVEGRREPGRGTGPLR